MTAVTDAPGIPLVPSTNMMSGAINWPNQPS